MPYPWEKCLFSVLTLKKHYGWCQVHCPHPLNGTGIITTSHSDFLRQIGQSVSHNDLFGLPGVLFHWVREESVPFSFSILYPSGDYILKNVWDHTLLSKLVYWDGVPLLMGKKWVGKNWAVPAWFRIYNLWEEGPIPLKKQSGELIGSDCSLDPGNRALTCKKK